MKIFILHSDVQELERMDEQGTLEQVNEITQLLQSMGMICCARPFTHTENAIAELLTYQPDKVFNLVESVDGRSEHNYLVPLLLESFGIPYTGGDARSLLCTDNKLLAKQLLIHKNLPTPTWRENSTFDLEDNSPFSSPYIIKPVTEDGSYCISVDAIVTCSSELSNLVATFPVHYKTRWIAEEYIEGREFYIPIISNKGRFFILPISEFVFFDECIPPIADYTVKWDKTSPRFYQSERRYDFPAQDSALLNQLRNLGAECCKEFPLSGYARIDVRVDRNNNPWILEINTNPDLSKDSGFIFAGKQIGLEYSDMISMIINDDWDIRYLQKIQSYGIK